MVALSLARISLHTPAPVDVVRSFFVDALGGVASTAPAPPGMLLINLGTCMLQLTTSVASTYEEPDAEAARKAAKLQAMREKLAAAGLPTPD